MTQLEQQFDAIYQQRTALASTIQSELAAMNARLQQEVDNNGEDSLGAEQTREAIELIAKAHEEVRTSLQQAQASIEIVNSIREQMAAPRVPSTDETADNEHVADSRIISLQQTLIDLRVEEAELLQTHGENHPQVRQLRAHRIS